MYRHTVMQIINASYARLKWSLILSQVVQLKFCWPNVTGKEEGFMWKLSLWMYSGIDLDYCLVWKILPRRWNLKHLRTFPELYTQRISYSKDRLHWSKSIWTAVINVRVVILWTSSLNPRQMTGSLHKSDIDDIMSTVTVNLTDAQ